MKTLDTLIEKIVLAERMQNKVEHWKQQKETIVFTNGCFDILHQGHVMYLAEAADLGSKLVVGLNADTSVRRQGKGADRPINDERSRAILLAALSFIDLIVIFEEDTPLRLITEIHPHILVKGGDYDVNELDASSPTFIVGSDLVREYGGLVKTIPLLQGFSTTSILERKNKSAE